jgi:hypothetical protein
LTGGHIKCCAANFLVQDIIVEWFYTYYGCLLQTKAHMKEIFETSTILQIAVREFYFYMSHIM